MIVPGIAECAAMMTTYDMLANIRQHSLVVAQLAEQLVTALPQNNQAGLHTSRELVIAGALLHDIAKTPCLKEPCNHAKLGAQICREHGYPEVATIVEEHVILKHHEPERYARGEFTAEEIVYYADKRVRHHQVVNLDERLEYIIDHYGKNDPVRRQLIRENFSRCIELETFLFQWLDFSPKDLGKL